MKSYFALTLISVGCFAITAHAKWSRLPAVEKKPVNSVIILSGTSVQDSSGIGNAGSLILGDTLKPANLSSGKSEATLKFSKQTVLQDVSFVSDGIEGKVAMSMSADGKTWNTLDSSVFSASDRLIRLSAGSSQGRYLRLQFDLVRGGMIRSFQALGTDSDANYSVTQPSDGSGAPLNFAAGIGGGRLLYISPELYGSRNEAVRTNQLEFPESDEKYRTAVYDLGQVRTLNEFGSVHSPRPVRFSVYAFDNLPEKEDWRGRLAFDPQVFDTTSPVASAEDTSGAGFLKAKPSKVVKSRYIALRWEPDFNPPAFSTFSVNITGAASITYSGGGITVSTQTDASGKTTAVVTSESGETLSISVDAGGNVTITQGGEAPSSGADGTQVSADSTDSTTINGVTVGAPSSSGAGFAGSPSPRR